MIALRESFAAGVSNERAQSPRVERLRACVGEDIADDVQPEAQVALVLELLERAAKRARA